MRMIWQTISNSDPWITALVGGCLVIAVACGLFSRGTTEIPPDKTVITFCKGGYKRDRAEMKELRAAFERLHPDIHLNVIRSNVTRKADTMIAAGCAPDLLQVPCDTADYYIQSGVLRDLVPFIADDPVLRRAFGSILFDEPGQPPPDYIEAMAKPFLRTVDGQKKLYAIPVSYTPFIIYYSKDLFDRYNVPYPTENWDWDDLREKALALTRDVQGRRPDQAGFDETRVSSYGFQFAWWQHGVECFIRQNGGRLVNEAGDRVVADDPRTIEALQFLYDLKYTDGVVPTGEGENARNISFSKGTLGMMLWGVFYAATLNDQARELDWDVAVLPRGPDGTRASVNFPNGMGVTSGSAAPEAALAYLKFLVSDEGMRIMRNHQVFLPTRRSILRERGVVDPTQKPASRWVLTHDIDNGYALAPYSTTAYYGDIYEVINDTFHDLLLRPRTELTPADAAARITKRGNIVLHRDRAVRGAHTFGIAALLLALVPIVVLIYRLISRPRKGRSKLQLAEERWGYALIAPWVLGFLIFAAFPILVSITLSFAQWQSLSDFTQAEFIGVENYQVALSGTDPKFWTSLWVTLRYALLAVPAGLVAGLAVAILMNQAVKGIAVFRTLYYIPAVLPSVAAAVLWWHLFDKNHGWVNRMLAWANPANPAQLFAIVVGAVTLVLAIRLLKRGPADRSGRAVGRVFPAIGLSLGAAAVWWWMVAPDRGWVLSAVYQAQAALSNGSQLTYLHPTWWLRPGWIQTLADMIGARYPIAWLDDEHVTPYIFVVMALWAVGGGMIIYLAGLQSIPTQLYEAAEIDGASRWQRLRNVTIPMLSPVIFFNLIMGVIGSFQVFNVAFVLFDGGTGPSDSALFYGLHLFREAFFKYRLGYASALAWILFVIILAFTALIMKSSPMWVYYESAKGRKA